MDALKNQLSASTLEAPAGNVGNQGLALPSTSAANSTKPDDRSHLQNPAIEDFGIKAPQAATDNTNKNQGRDQDPGCLADVGIKATQTARVNANRNHGLDCLRGVSVIVVLLSHWDVFKPAPVKSQFMDLGTIAVQCFFVLSGVLVRMPLFFVFQCSYF